MRNYEDSICEAIEYIVDHAISQADFDKTVQATIVECIDKSIGKYKVKYQDSSFYAFSNNPSVSYSKGTNVYILIPKNNMANMKSIVGTVEALGTDYLDNIENDSSYSPIGKNLIQNQNVFELCSYKKAEELILYDKESNINLINLDLIAVQEYISKADSLMCKMKIQTKLPVEQRYYGNYGINIELAFEDASSNDTVIKNYVIDIDQMVGSPYQFTAPTLQYGVFNIEKEYFKYINKISLFEYNFPNQEENKENDLFFSDLELIAVNSISESELNSYFLSLITDEGTFFTNEDKEDKTLTIKADVLLKGNSVDINTQKIEFYWFKANTNILTNSTKYNQYGGRGWECLNEYNIIQDPTENQDALISWIPGQPNLVIKKSDIAAAYNTYKCVAVYNNITLEQTVMISNKSSKYNITIESDSGNIFYYDVGSPTLTCKINGAESEEELIYTWGVETADSQYEILEETSLDNNMLKNYINLYNSLLQQVKNEEVLPAAAELKLANYKKQITILENKTRVEDNRISHLKVSEISRYNIYKCTVYKEDIYLGTASIVIYNSNENQNGYTLKINNGDQIFNYSEMGISPTSTSNKNRQEIKPLTFTIYNRDGAEIQNDIIDKCIIQWIVPAENTMLKIKNDLVSPTLDFDLEELYNINAYNNQIQLRITYQDYLLIQNTNFTFTKQGENGTNGTDIICKIVPNVKEGDSIPVYPMVTKRVNDIIWNFTPKAEGEYFKVQLWENSELIFDSSISDKDTKVKWSILQNSYLVNALKLTDPSNFVTNGTNSFSYNDFDTECPANIIKCTVERKGMTYYATLPIITVKINNENYAFNLKENTGFTDVLYSSTGEFPKYNNTLPFELQIVRLVNNYLEDVSLLTSDKYRLNYNWKTIGRIYDGEWENRISLNIKEFNKNKCVVIPENRYDGNCVTNALQCQIIHEADSEIIGTIHIPIQMQLNRYSNSAINGWDGNSVSIDEDGSGVILAPQVGAGIKNEDNTFTGVVMGTVKEYGSPQKEGLFGYNHGEQTIKLDAEDGSAAFGKKGSGQIILDPNTDVAMLYSYNFWKAYNDYGKPVDYTESNYGDKGLLIDLTTPQIRYANGNFYVGPDGIIHAKGAILEGYATEEGVETTVKTIIDETGLVSSVSQIKTDIENLQNNIKDVTNLNVLLSNENIFIATDDKGNNGDYSNAFTNITVYLGSSDVTSQSIYKVIAGEGVTGNWDLENKKYIINNLTTDNGYVDFQVTYDKINVTKRLSITKAKAGNQGETGLGIKNVTNKYAISNSKETAPTEWSEEIPIMTATNKYLWNYEIITYTDDTTKETKKRIIGVYGDTGAEGIGVTSVTELYYLSDSNKNAPQLPTTHVTNTDTTSGKWTKVCPTWISGYYYWTCSEILYSNNQYKWSEAILATGLNNANEKAAAANAAASDSATKILEINKDIKNLQNQVDGSIMTWFYPYEPTTENEPALSWNDEKTKNEHLGDLFYNTETGYCYRYMLNDNVYSWQKISDSDINKALDMAVEAKDTADNKRRVFYTTPTPPYDQGDLWVQGENGDIMRCQTTKPKDTLYSEEDWVLASKYTDDSLAEQIQEEAIGSVDVQYALSDFATQEPAEGEWKTEAPEWEKGKYMWQRTITTYVNGTIEKSQATCIQGAAGNGIVSTSTTYQAGDNGETKPTGEWSTSIPAVQKGQYLWTKTIFTYDDGTTHKTYSVSYQGTNGTSYYTYIRYSENEDGSNMVPAPTEKTKYIGIYTGTSSSIPSYSSFIWSKYMGEEGAQGKPGENGKTYYTWIKYADDINGTNMSDSPEGKFYIGIAANKESSKESTSPSDYVWSKFVGENGDDGRGIASTIVEYQVGTSGTQPPTGNWNTTVPTVTKGQYLWTKTTINYTSGDPSISYNVSYQGLNGNDGTSYYTYVRYSANADGAGMVTIPSDTTKYIGIYTGPSAIVPAYTAFTWSKYQGDKGAAGEKGKDGTTYYTWIKYADNISGANMSDNPAGKAYIGIAYNKTTEKESTNVNDYTWSKFVGEDGDSVTITKTEIKYAQGDNGTTIPIPESVWSLSLPGIADGKYLWTRTKVEYSDGNSTISYSTSYQSKDGINATQYYTYIRYATSATPPSVDISETPTNKTYIGIAVTTSTTAPTIYSEYKWSKYVGDNATQYYTYIRYSANSNGSNMTETPQANSQYIGTYIGIENTAPAYSSFKWSKYVGTDGTSPINIICGNEAQVIACNHSGNTTTATTITIPFAGYQGTTRKACTVTYSTLPSGITLNKNTAATASADGSLVFNVANNSNLGGNTTGTITLTFTCESQLVIKNFVWTKSLAGAEGATGKGISSITEYYLATNKITDVTIDTEGWQTDVSLAAISSEKPYLWNYEKITYTSGNPYISTPVIIGTYGEGAKLIDIISSAQIFKSEDGGKTFFPNTITLTPRLQNVAFGGWYYSLDGGNVWTAAANNAHGITLTNNVLTISKDSDLFTSTRSAINLKCQSTSSSIYDTITIAKLYDVTNLELGGRNLILNSNFYNEFFNWVVETGSHEIIEDEEYKHYVKFSIDSGDNPRIYTNTKNVWKNNQIYSYSFYAKADSTVTIQPSRSMIDKGSTHVLTNVWTKYTGTIKCTETVSAGSLSFVIGQKNINICLANVKLEIGNIASAWTPAPEDFYTTTQVDSKILQTSDTIMAAVDQYTILNRKLNENNQLHLINPNEGNGYILELTIYGKTSAFPYLTPSTSLTPSETLVPNGMSIINLVISDVSREIESNNKQIFSIDIGAPLRNIGDVRDTLEINKYEIILTRNIDLSASGIPYVLTKPQITKIGELILPTYSEDTYIYVDGIYNLDYYCNYIVKSEYTDIYASKVEMGSKIEETASSIKLEVYRAIDDAVDSIDGEYIVSKIEQTPDEIKLSANKISLEGYTTINKGFSIDEEGNATIANGAVTIDNKGITMANGTSIYGDYGFLTQFQFSSSGLVGFASDESSARVGLYIPVFIPDNFIITSAIIYGMHYSTWYEDEGVRHYGYSRNVKLYKVSDMKDRIDLHYQLYTFAPETLIDTEIYNFGSSSGKTFSPYGMESFKISGLEKNLSSGEQYLMFADYVHNQPTWPSAFDCSGMITASLYVTGYVRN